MKRKNNIRKITTEELEKMNPIIAKKFGNERLITGGTYEVYNGKPRYHVIISDAFRYQSTTMLMKIGKIVKETMGVNEVFSMGERLA